MARPAERFVEQAEFFVEPALLFHRRNSLGAGRAAVNSIGHVLRSIANMKPPNLHRRLPSPAINIRRHVGFPTANGKKKPRRSGASFSSHFTGQRRISSQTELPCESRVQLRSRTGRARARSRPHRGHAPAGRRRQQFHRRRRRPPRRPARRPQSLRPRQQQRRQPHSGRIRIGAGDASAARPTPRRLSSSKTISLIIGLLWCCIRTQPGNVSGGRRFRTSLLRTATLRQNDLTQGRVPPPTTRRCAVDE